MMDLLNDPEKKAGRCKMKVKKLLFLQVWLILLFGTLCGCERKEEETNIVDQHPVSYENLMKRWKESTTSDSLICWFQDESDKDWLEKVADNFEEEYSIKVNLVYYDGVSLFEDMNLANQKSEGPDLYIIGNDQIQLAAESGMAEVNTYLDEIYWKENYPIVAKQAVTYKEKQYGYPVYFDTYCLVYDANLLETAPKTIDDILTFLDEYEDTGSTKAVFRWDVADPYINSMFISSYANLFGENGDEPDAIKVNSEMCVKSMEYFQSLSAYLWMDKNNISHDIITKRIKEGTLVLGLCKSDILPTLYEMQAINENVIDKSEEEESEEENQATESNYQVSYVPDLTQEMSTTSFSTTYSALVNPYGKNVEIGNMFALYLSVGCAHMQYEGNGKLPVVNQYDKFESMQKIVYEQYLNSKPIPKVVTLGDYLSESGITYDKIWSGENAKEQLDALQQTLEEKIK